MLCMLLARSALLRAGHNSRHLLLHTLGRSNAHCIQLSFVRRNYLSVVGHSTAACTAGLVEMEVTAQSRGAFATVSSHSNDSQ